MKRFFSYLKYVLRHKWFVFLACMKMRVPVMRAVFHDWSKFSSCEWGPYARTFFNKDGSRTDLRKSERYDPNNTGEATEFSFAWLHHQSNKHHWQAWITIGDYGNLKALPIPETYIREMIADWIGAGWAISGRKDPRPWYETNKEKMLLHPETRKLIEDLIESL